ncbi:hypothetical protein, partial [Pseudomonas sp. R81]|uniref:hypothetical protein n=1 Tax=Pseudomonas sp. R81 TaxID=1144885 RepID=UPI00051915AF
MSNRTENMNSQNDSYSDDTEQNDSYAQSLMDEFEHEMQDSIEAELETLLLATMDDHVPKQGHLMLMLEQSQGAFPVSDVSLYNDDFWRFGTHRFAKSLSVHFNHATKGANDLKRALAFY